MANRKTRYTVGFIFDRTCQYVLLVHKRKPRWQQGKLNGVGGKVKRNETLIQCISRETREECCLSIKPSAWKRVGTIQHRRSSNDVGTVAVFAARFLGDRHKARRGDHEEVMWCLVDALPSNALSGVRWLVLLAREIVQRKDPSLITIIARYR